MPGLFCLILGKNGICRLCPLGSVCWHTVDVEVAVTVSKPRELHNRINLEIWNVRSDPFYISDNSHNNSFRFGNDDLERMRRIGGEIQY